MSILNLNHSNRIYWVPLPNNFSCPSGEKKVPVYLVSKLPEKVSIYLPGICTCLDNHNGMVSEGTTYTAGLCSDTVVKQQNALRF